VLCSPARRTKDTSDLIFPGFKYDINSVIYKDFLYNGSSETLINFIEMQDDFINSLLIIGHNPMLPKAISLLTNTLIDIYEPCTLTLINSKAWSSIHDSKLKFKFTPNQGMK
jgi:phosphohistidine phosphatase SixA